AAAVHPAVRRELGPVDNRADAALQGRDLAADQHADEVDVRDAGAAAEAAGAAEEVQGRPREADAGDDEALPRGGREPRRRVPPDPRPDAAVPDPVARVRELRVRGGLPVDPGPGPERPDVHPADPLR